jgi:hypothetical protein
MAPIQRQILDALAQGGEMSMTDLLSELRQKSNTASTAVKAAVLPLIIGHRVEMTDEMNLRLPEQK